MTYLLVVEYQYSTEDILFKVDLSTSFCRVEKALGLMHDDRFQFYFEDHLIDKDSTIKELVQEKAIKDGDEIRVNAIFNAGDDMTGLTVYYLPFKNYHSGRVNMVFSRSFWPFSFIANLYRKRYCKREREHFVFLLNGSEIDNDKTVADVFQDMNMFPTEKGRYAQIIAIPEEQFVRDE